MATSGHKMIYNFIKDKWEKAKDMKKAKLSLETAKQMYEQGGPARQFALDNYSEEELTNKGWPKSWDELAESKNTDINYMTFARGYDSEIQLHREDYSRVQQAVAFYKLLMIAKYMNDGWEPDFDSVRWYVDANKYNQLTIASTISKSSLINFKSPDMAQFSRKHHKELWKQYYQIK